ncbi:MAG: extracellular solute-binding protein [Clostridia bacterium]|nr:extracellular solute-binding protein [Clostridia bacterium]
MSFLKLTALLLAVLLLLSSCGIIIINRGETAETETTEDSDIPPLSPPTTGGYTEVAPPDDEEAAWASLASLPPADLGGMRVIFAVASETGTVFDPDEGFYRTAVRKRNEKIAAKYNASLSVWRISAQELHILSQGAKLAGSHFADFAVIRGGDFSVYVEGSLLLDLRSLPYVNFEADYYDQRAMEQLSVAGVPYGAVGYATEQPERYPCLYLNESMAEELAVSVDVDAVLDGDFTWDQFLATLSALPEGAVGLVSEFDRKTASTYAFTTTGQTFLQDNEDGKRRAAFDTDASRSMVEDLKTLFSLDTAFFGSKNSGTDFDAFLQGDALFALGTLGDIDAVASTEFAWEILPLPKLSEEISYHTPVIVDSPIMTALSTCQSYDRIGHILNAVNAASEGHLVGVFYDHALQNLVRSSRTLDMIDLIREAPLYDAALFLGEDSDAVREATTDVFYKAVTGDKLLSYYLGKKEKTLNRYLDKLH